MAPGWIRAKRIRHLTGDKAKLDRHLKALPLRRFGEPAEIAPLVADLASDLAAFTTGSVVVIDGGLMIP